MTLKINKVGSFDVNMGDYVELSDYINHSDEIIYDASTGLWDINGVKFSDMWLSDQVANLSHFINSVARMHQRKGIVVEKTPQTTKLLDLQRGSVQFIKDKK